MTDVVMPRLSDSMEEGTILQWLKQPGDAVSVGDELVEIETDKANMAYEADVAGKLEEILVSEGETVAIGTPIAKVGDGDGTERSAAGPVAEEGGPAGGSTPSSPPPPPHHSQTETVEPPAEPEGNGRPKASPVARRMAKERKLDLSQLTGSGPGGRIVKADVERAVASAGGVAGGVPRGAEARLAPSTVGEPAATGPAATAPNPETAKGTVSYEDLSKLQSTIARRMAESKATAPHFYLEAEIDMSRLVAARGQIKAGAKEGDAVPSFNDMVVKACALALREHPRANGAYRDGRFELYSRVNVGVAVAANDALVVPTVFDADEKNLRQIATDSRALARRVRDGQITPPELSGATFTVSNLGMFGIDSFAAVINPPQAAILAVGAIKEQAAIRDGNVASAHLMRVNLACDHRILYGAPAAEFLARIRDLLEEPLALAL
ncbi:MAG TPA: dihydrolipoamide acetyltransferase family protein [Solirubrobacterales bacterium]|jgi:pyruvate dehydrogenase E2 component (dihydrolipoamide acetyltransferase)|nr:dihydrolipoamide acetyltransferase family protein [Solirubrobacterales bacterium]